MGRHSHPDDLEPDLASATARTSADTPTAQPPKTTAVADLHFLLAQPRLLVLCVLAAVVPFGVYFAIVIETHSMHSWAVFLGAPMVFAGVTVGALLDRAYARLSTRPPTGKPVTVLASAAPVARGSRSIEGAHP